MQFHFQFIYFSLKLQNQITPKSFKNHKPVASLWAGIFLVACRAFLIDWWVHGTHSQHVVFIVPSVTTNLLLSCGLGYFLLHLGHFSLTGGFMGLIISTLFLMSHTNLLFSCGLGYFLLHLGHFSSIGGFMGLIISTLFLMFHQLLLTCCFLVDWGISCCM